MARPTRLVLLAASLVAVVSAACDPADEEADSTTTTVAPTIREVLGLDVIDSVDDVLAAFELGGLRSCELTGRVVVDGVDRVTCVFPGLGLEIRLLVDPTGAEARFPGQQRDGERVVIGDTWVAVANDPDLAEQVEAILEEPDP